MDVLALEDWFKANENEIFRYYIYKKIFTPYEVEGKFEDETVYEDETSFGYIKEVIPLPDGDLLIGFLYPDKRCLHITYCKLSEIRLEYYPNDREMLEEEITLTGGEML